MCLSLSLYLLPLCLWLHLAVFPLFSPKCCIFVFFCHISLLFLLLSPPLLFHICLLFVSQSPIYILQPVITLFSFVSLSPHPHLSLWWLLTSSLRLCELLGLNDFLLPQPVNSAPFDQANETENFHLSQIDFEPETTRGRKRESMQECCVSDVHTSQLSCLLFHACPCETKWVELTVRQCDVYAQFMSKWGLRQDTSLFTFIPKLNSYS